MIWVILLAGGSGTRLAGESLRRYGYAKPKQFCDFGGGTLLELTLERARRFAPDHRIVVVTTRTHRSEARPILDRHPAVQHLEQPRNRDTTSGLLLPILWVRAADPGAKLIIMPTDHAVGDESLFIASLVDALDVVWRDNDAIAMLGAAPGGLDDGYGWVLPAAAAGRCPSVARFREKPPCEEVAGLRAAGALLNTFVLVAWAATLERAFSQWAPESYGALRATQLDPTMIEDTFERLTDSNFSRDVLEHIPQQLRLVPLPEAAGWSDIGTPERLAQVSWRPPRAARAAREGPLGAPSAA